MPRLSIVIPCLELQPVLEDTLVSVLQSRPADCEVVLAHATPYDDPYNLCDEVRQLCVAGASSIVGLVNAVLPQTSGEIVHLLAPGLVVSEFWTEPALAHFHDAEVAAVSPLMLTAEGRIATAGVTMTTAAGKRHLGAGESPTNAAHAAWPIVGPSLLGGFYHRDVLLSLGGFDGFVGDALADLDVALAIEDLALRCVSEPTPPLRWSDRAQPPALRSTGREAERFFRKHSARCTTAGRYVVHPLAAVVDALALLPSPAAMTQLGGRLLAWLEANPIGEHQQRLQTAAELLEQAANSQTISLSEARDVRQQPKSHSNLRAA